VSLGHHAPGTPELVKVIDIRRAEIGLQRTWRVMAQADGPYRESVEDIANLRTRNNQGEMVPIGSMVNISTTYGPDPVIRYNGYPAADLIGDADPRVLSSSQAMTHLEELSKQILPNGMNIEWT
ncbi:efflux RND transporter permease subunit, partial [Escherichia sp. HC-CC]